MTKADDVIRRTADQKRREIKYLKAERRGRSGEDLERLNTYIEAYERELREFESVYNLS